LKTALHRKGQPEQRQRIQMVLLRESGMTQPAIADAMGVSLSTVNRAHMAYDHGGLKARRSYDNLEEQGPTSNGPMPATEAICPSTSRSDYADMAPLQSPV
jgi:hypothetical protein